MATLACLFGGISAVAAAVACIIAYCCPATAVDEEQVVADITPL